MDMMTIQQNQLICLVNLDLGLNISVFFSFMLQRQEDIHRKWEEFKAIQRDDKYSYLEQKVALQRELIRAYDDLFLERRLKTDRKLEEVRELLSCSCLIPPSYIATHLLLLFTNASMLT